MKRMGLGIVYADYNRIFINSNKYTYDNAKQAIAYSFIISSYLNRYIFDTIQSKDVFRFINYIPQDVYSSIIWYNTTNFTGYRVWSEEMEEVATMSVSSINNLFNSIERYCNLLVIYSITS